MSTESVGKFQVRSDTILVVGCLHRSTQGFHKMPANIPHRMAASFAGTYSTAWLALKHRVNIKEGSVSQLIVYLQVNTIDRILLYVYLSVNLLCGATYLRFPCTLTNIIPGHWNGSFLKGVKNTANAPIST